MNEQKSHALGFNKLSLGFVAFVVGIFGLVMLFQGRAAEQNPGAPSIYLTPTNETYAANQEFSVNLRANSGNIPVSAVAAQFTYPENLVDFVRIETTNTPYVTIPTSTSYGQDGVVRHEAGLAAGADPVTGDNFIARITFRTKTSSGTINLDFNDSNTILLNANTIEDVIQSSNNRVGATMTVDTSAPTVSISSPANNATVAKGDTTTITVSATDNNSVSSVDILIDDVGVSTLTSSPFSYDWDTSNISLGNHTIQARARDPQGNTASSQVITVNVADRTKPSVTLTAPSNDATVAGSVSLSADATDDSGGTGIAKVEFLVNSEIVNSDSVSPYSFSWDSSTVADGSYTITARAYDKASPANVQNSQTVTINVDNTDDTAPSTPGNFRATSRSLSSISLAWNASTDNKAVTGYRISRNGNVIATTSNLTYTDNSLTEGTSYNYEVVALDEAGNSSPAASVSAATTDLKVGDFDKNDVVELQDLAILLSKWQSQDDPDVDLSGNGVVDIYDLSIFLSAYPRN